MFFFTFLLRKRKDFLNFKFLEQHHCQLDGERYMNIVNLTFYRLDTPKAIRKRELEAENEAKQ